MRLDPGPRHERLPWLLLTGVVALVLAVLFSTPLSAWGGVGVIEEVVTTATKRTEAESAQDVPASRATTSAETQPWLSLPGHRKGASADTFERLTRSVQV